MAVVSSASNLVHTLDYGLLDVVAHVVVVAVSGNSGHRSSVYSMFRRVFNSITSRVSSYFSAMGSIIYSVADCNRYDGKENYFSVVRPKDGYGRVADNLTGAAVLASAVSSVSVSSGNLHSVEPSVAMRESQIYVADSAFIGLADSAAIISLNND